MMRTRSFLRASILLCWSLSTLVFPACSSDDSVQTDVRYRTIRADPLRDTPQAQALNTRGLEKLNDEQLDAAAELFGEALEADVTYGPAHNNLGKVYLAQKDLHRAALEFQAAIELMPDHAAPVNNLALTWEQAWVADPQVGSLDKAIALYRKAVELDPRSIEYKANLARALDRRGDRSDELRQLVAQIIEHDTRADWLIWAKELQARLGLPD
jgi:tetratricopeptide (TPR) repeat protein